MSLLPPLALYLLALAVRFLVASEIPFPTTEPGAYYLDVAANLVAGQGLVADGVWSYATPPLEVPKPAFELWLPMSTFVSAAAMSLLGSSFWAAQVGGAVVGAAVAPLAWAIGREAARIQGLDRRRGAAVAMAGGLLAAVLSPLVLAAAVPDSYTPFTVFMLASALLVPRAIGVRDGEPVERPGVDVLAGLALGLCLGLAYLSRQEVIWLGLTIVLMLAWTVRRRSGSLRPRDMARGLWPVVLGGLVVVSPWLLRNWLELGSPFPGQAIENLFLVENEDIFAFRERPSAATYLGQGLSTVLLNPLEAAWDGVVNVIAVPAFPVGVAGLVALAGMRRSPALRRPTALLAILASGALTFASTVLLFPVATLWGTFMHASGPLLVGLAVVAALGGDALLARISARRAWERPNIIIAPVALVAIAASMTAFQVAIVADQSRATEARYAQLAVALEEAARDAGARLPQTIITDRPMWLASALGTYAVALPDEDLEAIGALAARFDTSWIVIVDGRGRYPEALLDPSARDCLDTAPARLAAGSKPAWLFRLAPSCRPT